MVAPAVKKVGKAGTAVAAGGGPEDPIGDAVAVAELAKPAKKPVEKKTTAGQETAPAKTGGKGATTKAPEAKAPGAKSLPSPSDVPKKISGKIVGKNLLLTEFTLCMAVLIFGTIVSPKNSKDDVHRLVVKGTALMAVFFILAIMSAGGPGPQKVASAVGLLVSMAYLLNSSDIHNIINWINSFFKKPSTSQDSHTTTSTTGFTY